MTAQLAEEGWGLAPYLLHVRLNPDDELPPELDRPALYAVGSWRWKLDTWLAAEQQRERSQARSRRQRRRLLEVRDAWVHRHGCGEWVYGFYPCPVCEPAEARAVYGLA